MTHINYHSLNLRATPYLSQTLTQCLLFLFLSDYFDKTIHQKFTKRGVIYLFMQILLLISSQGKSYQLVLSTLIFYLVIPKHNSTYTLLLHLYLIPFLLYYISLIITESRLSDRTVCPLRNIKRSLWVNVKVLWLLRQPTLFVSSSVFFNWILSL